MPNGEKSARSDTPTVYIKPRHDDGPTSSKPLPGFNPDDLVGRTFLLLPGDNGERLRAKLTGKVAEDIEQADGERVQTLSFILGIGNGKLEEILQPTCGSSVVEFWGLPPLILLLQCANRLGLEICSFNSCQREQGSWLS